MGKIRCKSIRMTKIWEKVGDSIPVVKVMGPNRNNLENYEDLEPIARNMKPTLWVLGENFSFGLLPETSIIFREVSNHHREEGGGGIRDLV